MKVKVINANGYVHNGEIKKLNSVFDISKEAFKSLSINTRQKFLKEIEEEKKVKAN